MKTPECKKYPCNCHNGPRLKQAMSKEFDLEQWAKAIVCRWTERRVDEWRIQEMVLQEEIAAFGRRCQDVAYEKAAQCGDGIVVYSSEATNLITTIRGKILALKSPAGDKAE